MFTIRSCRFYIVLLLLLTLSACADKKIALKPLRIVCVGDSITYGYKLPNPAAQSYPAQLARLSHGQWSVMNSGVNGATLLNNGDIPFIRQKAYQRALQSRPDVVVVMLGTNDMKDKNWQYLQSFEADYTKLVKSFRKLPTHPHIIACTIPPVFTAYPNGLNGKKVLEINKKVKQLVVHDKIDLLDIHTFMMNKQALFSDGVHPNARGAQEIAAQVLYKISSL
ncbi:MAG: hypothetical protein DSY80_06755 [Desulfocapsa sp.]|nr:MAG: hypothetical protein DSY80_06755 [Desulfocapsa sp.]